MQGVLRFWRAELLISLEIRGAWSRSLSLIGGVLHHLRDDVSGSVTQDGLQRLHPVTLWPYSSLAPLSNFWPKSLKQHPSSLEFLGLAWAIRYTIQLGYVSNVVSHPLWRRTSPIIHTMIGLIVWIKCVMSWNMGVENRLRPNPRAAGLRYPWATESFQSF